MLADGAIPVALHALDRGVDHVVHERGLARSADAGDARQQPERNFDVDVLQVVFARAQDAQPLHARPAARAGHGNRQLVAQVARRERPRVLQQSLAGTGIDHAAALFAGAQPHVHDCVGDANHVGVVLDHDDRVALIAQLQQDRDQPLVVARMQADRRLVQHVQRVDQRRPERRGQIDALRLAARQRRRQPVERQVVEPHVGQEAQPAPNLAQDLVGDRRILLAERQRLEEGRRIP